MNDSINININKKTTLLTALILSYLTFATGETEVTTEGVSESDVTAMVQGLETQIEDLESKELPIGSVALWGSTIIPTGWIEMAGQSTSSYPELASIYGSNLPNMRGKFVRGWDNGAGIDENPSRTLNSEQNHQLEEITGKVTHMNSYANGYAAGTASYKNGTGSLVVSGIINSTESFGVGYSDKDAAVTLDFDASRIVKAGTETRPKNIALIHIVKIK